MDSSIWGACLLLLCLAAYGVRRCGKVFRPAVERPLSTLSPQEAQTVWRYRLYYRCGALCCFLAAAVSLLFGEHRIACLVFVGLGFMCQYGVFRLRCRFPAATETPLAAKQG